MRLLCGQESHVARWVAARIPYAPQGEGEPFGPCAALGVLDTEGKALAGVVFHDYSKKHQTIGVSMAAESARWCQPSVVRAVLAYPFEQVGVNLLWCAVRTDNLRCIKMLKGLGFVREGILKHRFGKGHHAAMFRMEPRDYRKLIRRFDGSVAAAEAA